MSRPSLPGGVVHKLPQDLKTALVSAPRPLAAWEDITPLARNEWICWVTSCKKPETRLDTSREQARILRRASAGLLPASLSPTSSLPCPGHLPPPSDGSCDIFGWQMTNLRDAIRIELDRERRRQELLQVGRKLRLAWTFGKTTLYKYMSLADQERRDRVLDVLRSSRVYLSAPSQLNDATDCRPRFELAKPLSDPDCVRELQADEERMIAEQHLTPDEVDRLRAQ